jgi:chromosome segregation ATPase
MSTRNVDDLIVMLARRARAARRKVQEVEAYHRGLTEERDVAAEAARLAQELEAARLATQDADERAKARERQLVQAHDVLNATERAHGMASERVRELVRERDEARAALADALTRVEAREEEIRRLGNRVEAAERARGGS